ncbi:MAG: phage head-tail connector protein [Clostridia bacterium]|nr:phage head-tail connector protein [Clostridia bacterium]MBP3650552.1 phage head-tail connector protein [Clostridia bacterium]
MTVLKRRLSLNADQDALLSDLLSDAEMYVTAYTGRAAIPAALDGTVVELAAMQYARLGLQGESSHQEGGVSITVDSLPDSIRQVLNRHRLARVVG